MKVFIQSGTGTTATLEEANPSKVKVYDTWADAEADFDNINNHEIICVKEDNVEEIRDATVPVGTIVTYPNNSNIPDGWLLCDGSTIPEKYAQLREIVGTTTPVSIDHGDMTFNTEDITDTVTNVNSAYRKVVRSGNVITVYADVVSSSLNSSNWTTILTGLPKPLNNTLVTVLPYSSVRGFVPNTFVFIDSGILRCSGLYSSNTSDALRLSVTYITNEYDGTARYNIIKAAPNQSEVPDIELNTPVGTVISYNGQTTPVGYLKCDGSTFDKDKYPLLYTALGNSDTLPTEIDYPEFIPNTEDITSAVTNICCNKLTVTRTGNVVDVYASVPAQSASGNTAVASGLPVPTAQYAYGSSVDGNGINHYARVESDGTCIVSVSNSLNVVSHITYITNEYDGTARYRYIKATSGIDSEEETIATAVNEAIAPIGTMVERVSASKEISATDTNVTVQTLRLPSAGVWIINGHLELTTGGSSFYLWYLSCGGKSTMSRSSINGGGGACATLIVDLSTAQDVEIIIYSQVNSTAKSWIEAVRVK